MKGPKCLQTRRGGCLTVESQVDRVAIWGSLFPSEWRAVAFPGSCPRGAAACAQHFPVWLWPWPHEEVQECPSGPCAPAGFCVSICVRVTPDVLCTCARTRPPTQRNPMRREAPLFGASSALSAVYHLCAPGPTCGTGRVPGLSLGRTAPTRAPTLPPPARSAATSFVCLLPDGPGAGVHVCSGVTAADGTPVLPKRQ